MLDEEKKRGEEGGTRGRRDEENEKMKKLLKKMKNEKVARGRIIGLAGPCFLFLTSFFPACLGLRASGILPILTVYIVIDSPIVELLKSQLFLLPGNNNGS